jgi:hypothetical protein
VKLEERGSHKSTVVPEFLYASESLPADPPFFVFLYHRGTMWSAFTYEWILALFYWNGEKLFACK